MTDTSTLREARNKVHTLRLFGPITDPLVKKSEVLAILDAQTEQPDLQLPGPKVEGDAPDQTGVSPGPDAVREAEAYTGHAFVPKDGVCATTDCGRPASYHFVRGRIGTLYCADCYSRILAQGSRR